MYISFFDLIIFFVSTLGGVASFLTAIRQALPPKKKRCSSFLIWLTLLLAIVQIEIGFSRVWIAGNHFIFCNLFGIAAITMMSLFGPLLFLHYKSSCDPKFIIKTKQRFHFLLPLLVAFITVSFIISTNNQMIQTNSYKKTLNMVNIISFLLYVIFLLKKTPGKVGISKKESPTLALYLTVISVLMILPFGSRESSIFHIAQILVSIIFVLIYFKCEHNPEISHLMNTENEKHHYLQSRLNNLNIDRIILNINQLAQGEKVYRDENISLNSFSSKLGITPHQLSELLNTKFEKNFFNFINELRVEDAKDLLKYRSDLTVTEIAFQTGFNSTSSFYRSFKRKFGVAPSFFREIAEVA